MVVRSKQQAHAIFEAWRTTPLARARGIALALALRDGYVHTRAVRREMVRLNLLHAESDERWFGSLLSKAGVFTDSGERHIPESDGERTRSRERRRGGHGKGATVKDIVKWKLRAEVQVLLDYDPLVSQPEDDYLREVIAGYAKRRPSEEDLKAAGREQGRADVVIWLKGRPNSLMRLHAIADEIDLRLPDEWE